MSSAHIENGTSPRLVDATVAVEPEPLVSVIVTCYRQEAFVRECLDSIRAQTYTTWELIIADDASDDDTLNEVRDWLRLHGVAATLLVNERNLGLCATLNRAIAVVRGDFFGVVAADDLWEPEKLATQVRALEDEGPEAAVAFSDVTVIDRDGGREEHGLLRGVVPPSGHVFRDLFDWNFVPAPSALIRTAALREVGRYDESLIFEDWDMWLRLAHRFTFVFSHYPSARYRVLSNSMSSRADLRRGMFDSYVRIFEKWTGIDDDLDAVIGRRLMKWSWQWFREHGDRDVLPIMTRARELAPGREACVRVWVIRLGVPNTSLDRIAAIRRHCFHAIQRHGA